MTRYTRAKQIIDARTSDPVAADAIETSIALDLVGPGAIAHDKNVRSLAFPEHGYLSPMAATEEFANELQRGLIVLAKMLDLKPPQLGKYSPLVATRTISREVWRARQVADELGIPYSFYVEYAIHYWYEIGNKRMPRPSQLTSDGMAVHVMQLWADPKVQHSYPLFGGWDNRFYVENYRDEPLQRRALELIEQRVTGARANNLDPASVLAHYLGAFISEQEAERRLGPELVARALEVDSVAIAAHIDAVSIHGDGIEAVLHDR